MGEMRMIEPIQAKSAPSCVGGTLISAGVAVWCGGEAHRMAFKHMRAEENCDFAGRVGAAQPLGRVRSSHWDRISKACSRMSESYTCWKSGEQRMRDTCDGLYPVSRAISRCFFPGSRQTESKIAWWRRW